LRRMFLHRQNVRGSAPAWRGGLVMLQRQHIRLDFPHDLLACRIEARRQKPGLEAVAELVNPRVVEVMELAGAHAGPIVDGHDESSLLNHLILSAILIALPAFS